MGYNSAMISFHENNTEDTIVLELLNKSLSANALRDAFAQQGKKISLASLYDQLHKLIEKNIVIKTSAIYSINREWWQKIQDLFAPKNEYILSPGEKMKYQLHKLSRAEMYWKHVIHSLYVSYPDESVYMYNPHSFWTFIPGRRESENLYAEHHEKNKRFGYYVLGGNTIHDIALRKQHSAQFYKIDLKNIPQFKRTEHVTVIGDIVFTIILSTSLARKIDEIYEQVATEKELIVEISELENFSWNIVSKIEHNHKKALILKKRIGKQFLSRKQLVELG